MTYLQLAYLHLATIVPAFGLGTFLLLCRKGTPHHRRWGRVYLGLMVLTALSTLFMKAQNGPTLFGHFGFIHALSLLVLYTAPSAYFAARRGDAKTHSGNMIGLYVGGILIAGVFAFTPGRLLHEWIWGTPASINAMEAHLSTQ